MKSRWMIVSAMVVAVGLAWAGAATDNTSTPSSSASATLTASPAQPQADPYVGASTITTEPPTDRKSCQTFASDCVFDGGPCGPGGVCHCQYRPTGWICAR